MFDTHCHLNFKAFNSKVDQVVEEAKKAGVTHIVIPGTDVETSKRAVEIADKFEHIYAAVGVHPHHVFEIFKNSTKIFSRVNSPSDSTSEPVVPRSSSQSERSLRIENIASSLKPYINHRKVVAIGEVGVDRHYYANTKHENYLVNEEFVLLQKEFLKAQIKLATTYKKSLILHNREAKKDILAVLNKVWDSKLEGRSVFHCCEPDSELLEFAKQHKIYLGVDGDVTYRRDKQEFVKKIPLEMLVLETDSPFLLPEPLKSDKKFPNRPENLRIIAEFIAKLRGLPLQSFMDNVSDNSMKLFNIFL